MSKVNFYVLAQPGAAPREAFACRLAEKAYRLKHRVHLHTPSRADAERIDELLWTFRDGSFVPHALAGGQPAEDAPVTIGHEPPPGPTEGLLINLCDNVPEFANSFERVAELVSGDDDGKRSGRLRFAAYRDRGHSIETHNV